jgi:hypothetical protein
MKNFRFRWLLLIPLCASAQDYKPIIDNDRVVIWDVTWTKNQPGPAASGAFDSVTICLDGGDFKTTLPDGAPGTVTRKTGDAVFKPKGVHNPEMWTGAGAPPRTIVIALKDHPASPIPNPTGYPLAFPRPGVKKLFENDRILMWDYRWQPGVPTPMHFHDKDVVVTYLEDGDLTSVTPDGKSVVNPYRFGVVRFNLGNRSHQEVLTRGTLRAIMVELK